MYKEYFGLSDWPFSIAPNPHFLYMSARHREALAHLLYGIRSDGGFILLTGEVGTGKTTVCRCLLHQLPHGVDIAYVLNPRLTAKELLESICDELGIEVPPDGSIKVLVDRLNAYLLRAYEQDRRTVLIIDEAQNLSVDVLEQLRLLTNLETNQRKLLQIVLLGQPELLDLLGRQDLRQLSQRVTARFHLDALTRDEVAEYIDHRLDLVGGKPGLFTPRAVRRIVELSGGIPRVVNLICDRALLGAYAENRPVVDPDIVSRAAGEVLGRREKSSGLAPFAYAIAASLAVVAGAAGYLYANGYRPGDLVDVSSVTPVAAVAAPETSGSRGQEPSASATLSADPVASTEPANIATVTTPDTLPETDSIYTVKGESRFDSAINLLLERWNTTPDDATAGGCEAVADAGLRCLSLLGSLRDLKYLDRPAVVRLSIEGTDHYLALVRADDRSVWLTSGSGNWHIADQDITRTWDGNFTILWQPPPAFRLVQRGDTGTVVDALYVAMNRIDGKRPDVPAGSPFDVDLETRLKAFQITKGIRPDGIAGEQTWIHVNSVLEPELPRLEREGS